MVLVRCAECSQEIEKFPSQVKERNFCNRKCLGAYRSKHYVGDKAAHWKGGTKMDRERIMIHLPDHPHAQSNGYVYRYRLVAEKMLGRLLRTDEIVHHIDGDESNDDPSNLLVMTQKDHASKYDARRKSVGVIPEACGKGHPLEGGNLYTYSRNGLTKWSCRTCQRANWRRYDERRRAERSAHGIQP